jgi:alanine dehydrogenase
MIIGTPKEIKNNEYRVAVTPGGVKTLVGNGHKVLVEKDAGIGSGFSNEDYIGSGAEIVAKKELFDKSEMIYKVKEFLPEEYDLLKEEQIAFTYIHSNSNRDQTDILLNKKVVGIAYEDIEDKDGNFPLLRPMSEIAGKGGMIAGLQYAQKIYGGAGLMMARVHGVRTPDITIIGAGIAGMGAAEIAAGLGNKVTILDINFDKLEEAKEKLPPNVELLYSDKSNLEECLKRTDIVVNCILWPKWQKDHLISRDMLKLMKAGSLIVDVACDEAGAIETCKSTSHSEPVYKVDGIVHYCVDNIPAAFPQTSTSLLCNTTLPYTLEIANKGYRKALIENKYLRKGLTCYLGELTLEETGRKQNRPYKRPEEVLNISLED